MKPTVCRGSSSPRRGACLLLRRHGRGLPQVTLKIEVVSDRQGAALRLSGRVASEYLGELEAQVRRLRPRLVLDLDEVTLVDLGGVRFFVACEAEGIELRHCAPYIREWMAGERGREEGGDGVSAEGSDPINPDRARLEARGEIPFNR